MTVSVRPAAPADAEAMCAVINPIIAEGRSTAHRTPFGPARMRAHYIAPPRLVAAIVAQGPGGLLGFQVTEMADPDWQGPLRLPADWALIASFVAQGAQGQGIGRALFAASLAALAQKNVKTVDATIRHDNMSGLAYYSAMGFRDYARLEGVRLSDGTRVTLLRKRYDLA